LNSPLTAIKAAKARTDGIQGDPDRVLIGNPKNHAKTTAFLVIKISLFSIDSFVLILLFSFPHPLGHLHVMGTWVFAISGVTKGGFICFFYYVGLSIWRRNLCQLAGGLQSQ